MNRLLLGPVARPEGRACGFALPSRGRIAVIAAAIVLLLAGAPHPLCAQADPPAVPAAATAITPKDAIPPVPAGYVIGTDDVLSIVFWREKEMSGDVVVRPDGKISLPLLNDMQAAGLTPDQLRESLREAANQYLAGPSVTVIVKQINSLRVFITGEVGKPGAYPLTTPTTVMQLIAVAGGVTEYADKKHIVVMRIEDGRQTLFPFNYETLQKRRNVRQDIQLKPGDTVIVP